MKVIIATVGTWLSFFVIPENYTPLTTFPSYIYMYYTNSLTFSHFCCFDQFDFVVDKAYTHNERENTKLQGLSLSCDCSSYRHGTSGFKAWHLVQVYK